MTIKTRPQTLAPQTRSITLQLVQGDSARSLVDADKRTMTLSFASETPVDMWYGTEILSLAAGAMRTGVRQTSMPLIFNHDMGDLLGIVERVSVGADRKAYADVRFGKDERGDWAMAQVQDGVLVNVSFRYRVFKWVEDTEAETLTAIDWEPYEVSLVTVPADPTVGAGRAADTASENGVSIEVRSAAAAAPAPRAPGASPAPVAQQPSQPQQEQSMTLRTAALLVAGALTQFNAVNAEGGTSGGGGAVEGQRVENGNTTTPPNPAELQARGAQFERERINEIGALCDRYKLADDLRRSLIQKGATIEQARLAAADEVMKRATNDKPADFGGSSNPDLTEREKSRYSMIRAVNAAIGGNGWKDAGFELECSNHIAKMAGRGPTNERSFFIPTNLQMAMRAAYTVGTPGSGTTGGTLVATNLLTGSFIDVLRNQARVLRLGAQVISGLVGSVDIPRQTGQASSFWTTEGTNTTESEATFDKVSLAMKTIGTYSQITRNMLMQATPDIDMLARADLMKVLALGIDLAALSGSGSSGQPLGVANQSGIGSVVGGTNGANITIDHLIALETAVASANAPDDSLAYLVNAKTVGSLKGLKSTTGQYLWTNAPGGGRSGTPGEINGYPVTRSNQARSTLTKGSASGVCSELFFGAWSELLIGEWGVLEIVPNPYDTAVYKNGGVLLRALQSVDIAVRHAASFATMSDALTP